MKAFTLILITISFFFSLACTGGPRKPIAKNGKNVKFEWDFSREKKFVYTFHQTVNNEMVHTKGGAVDKMHMTGDGFLTVKVKANKLADVILSDILLKSINYDQDGKPTKEDEMELPTNVAQDMKPDGSFGERNVDLLFGILLPLPLKTLNTGESDKIALQIPFNANGSVLFSKGFNTLTFKGYESLLGRTCAVFKGIIDISDFKVPEELYGEYENYSTGEATYYFDTDARCYVGADIHWVMNAIMDSKSNDETHSGMYMDSKSDNVFEIRLDRIE